MGERAKRLCVGTTAVACAVVAWGLSAAPEVITIFRAATGGPMMIAAGPDGNLWFTEVLFHVGRISPTGSSTEFLALGPLQCSNCFPSGCRGRGIVAGPDGNMWFVNECARPSMARISPAGVITGITGVRAGQQQSITVGADGNIWTAPFGGGELNLIFRVTPAGVVTEFPIPSPANPEAIGAYSLVKGPDGNVWFTTFGANKIGRVTPLGEFTEYPLTEFLLAYGAPLGITSGPDGALWFTTTGKYLGRITTGGEATAFPIPEYATSSSSAICSGPDGNLWYTELTPSGVTTRVARCTPTGVVIEFPIPLPPRPVSNAPWSITAGPDRNIWFTVGPFEIGRVSLDVVAAMEAVAIPTLSEFNMILLGTILAATGVICLRLWNRS